MRSVAWGNSLACGPTLEDASTPAARTLSPPLPAAGGSRPPLGSAALDSSPVASKSSSLGTARAPGPRSESLPPALTPSGMYSTPVRFGGGGEAVSGCGATSRGSAGCLGCLGCFGGLPLGVCWVGLLRGTFLPASLALVPGTRAAAGVCRVSFFSGGALAGAFLQVGTIEH